VLGNKCAGQNNLETVHFRETLASGNFLAWSSALASFYVTMVAATPYKLFLKVPWLGQQAACQL
jgi:hypothetical protein